jgi:hypothetical protein
MAAAGDALAGRLEEAQRAMAHLRSIDPELRVSNLKDLTPLRRPADIRRGSAKGGLARVIQATALRMLICP